MINTLKKSKRRKCWAVDGRSHILAMLAGEISGKRGKAGMGKVGENLNKQTKDVRIDI